MVEKAIQPYSASTAVQGVPSTPNQTEGVMVPALPIHLVMFFSGHVMARDALVTFPTVVM